MKQTLKNLESRLNFLGPFFHSLSVMMTNGHNIM
jgi:hypothetical protein